MALVPFLPIYIINILITYCHLLITGCYSIFLAVETEVGRGIELWNRDTMMAYREDPFLDSTGTHKTSEELSAGSTARKWLVAVPLGKM